ncbi:MAG: hypothetical protein ABSD67_14165 [Terracidiphilus sp.]
MTVERVRELIGLESIGHLTDVNDHRIALQDALVGPRRINVIARQVKKGRVMDENLHVWLVGQEVQPDGYKLILRDDGSQFGLASSGFPDDKSPVLVGWYGSLLAAFMGM